MRACGAILVASLCLAVGACGFDTSGVATSSRLDAPAAPGDGTTSGPPDASVPDAMPDAMPDAAPCGSDGLACCMTGDACDSTSECGNNDVCTACGGLFESCCDHGTACRGLQVCSFGTCV